MEFLKVIWENLRKGPVTEAFPFGEATAPERFRGRVRIDPKLCVGCGTCMHVCVADAIKVTSHADEGGFDVTVWRNACCLCAQCRQYCPTKAISLVNDWHTAHRAEQKYTFIERASVRYDSCESCGARMSFLPPEVSEKVYTDHPEVNISRISRLCPQCRRIEQAVAEEKACHIDFIERLAVQNQACPINFPEQQAQLGLVCLLPKDKPDASPDVVPHTIPDAVPNAIPDVVPHTIPDAAPAPVAESLPRQVAPPIAMAVAMPVETPAAAKAKPSQAPRPEAAEKPRPRKRTSKKGSDKKVQGSAE